MPLQSAFTLNSNEIFGTIANMIISQEVFADNIGNHQTLVDKARVDGGLFGDKKLYYATDALETRAWGNDSEATNLLAINRPADPKVQDITLDVFRQIDITIDNYLSKRAWSSEGAFAGFNSVILGWMRETKKIYDGTLYNCYIGTTSAAMPSGVGAKQSQSLVLASTLTAQERAYRIAEKVANILVEMSDYNRDYNDYGFMRSYNPGDVKVVWNAKYINEIKKVDTPAIYHKEGLVDKFAEDVLPAKYFGQAPVVGTDIDSSTSKAISGHVIRAKKEIVLGTGANRKHYFAGEQFGADVTFGSGKDVAIADAYVENAKVICKILVKFPPYMSAFEVGTSFFNPRSLTENHYLTFGHNTLEYLENYPYVTLVEA